MARPDDTDRRRRPSREEGPRRRRTRDEEDDRPRRKRKEDGGASPVPWIIGGGGILAALILVTVAVVVARNRGGTPSGPNNPGEKDRAADKGKPPDDGPPAVAWQYIPDAATPRKLMDAAMPLSEDPQNVFDIAFSDLSAAQGAVTFLGESGEDPAVRPIRVDRFDLTTGRLMGTVELWRRGSGRRHTGMEPKPEIGGEVGMLTDLSPDGSRLAVITDATHELTVWDLAAKKLLNRWPVKSLGLRRWMRFADNDHVFTFDGRSLVLSKVADASVKYHFDELKGVPALSATRKYAAFRTKRGIELVEVASGKVHGLMENEHEPFFGHLPPSFSLDGKEMYVGTVSRLYREVEVKYAFAPKDQPPEGNDFLFEVQTGALNMCRRDLARNVWLDKTRGVFGPGPVRPGEGEYVGQGWCVYQRGATIPFCRYIAEPPVLVGQSSIDGRVWVVEPGPGGKGRVLRGRPVVSPAAKQVARQLSAGKAKAIAPPGSVVNVVVTSNNASLKKALENAAASVLAAHGMKAGKGELTFSIDAQEVVTGKFVPYADPAGGVSENAADRRITCIAVLSDQSGKELHKFTHVAGPPSRLTFQRGGASKAVEGEVFTGAQSWALRIQFPPTAYEVDGKPVHLPVTVPFIEKAK